MATSKELKFWMNQAKSIEYLVGNAVGFPVQLYWLDVSNGYQYQIMIHAETERNPYNDYQKLANRFWNWHVVHNEQFFDTPLAAADNFVKKWKHYLKDRKAQAWSEIDEAKRQAITDRIKRPMREELLNEIREFLGEDEESNEEEEGNEQE